MADRKITDLTALTTPASADVLPIVDVSEAAAADKNKKITVGELFKGVPDGTAATPAIAFESDDGNGIFLSTTDTVGIATNGSSRMTVSTTAVTSTLPVIVPDGTAGAPSVAFTGSGTDTGFYSDAANTLAASTGGTNALYIDSSQRVGIGTTSPGTTAGGVDISSGGIGAIIGADGSASTRTNSTDKVFRIGSYHYTNSEEPVCIAFGQNLNNNNELNFGGGTAALNAATYIRFFTAANNTTTSGSEHARIDSSGRLGLGTSTPDALLQVGALDASGTSRGGIAVKTAASAGTFGESAIYIEESSGAEGFYIGVNSDGALFFSNSGTTTPLFIGDDDRVGIGNTTPGSFDASANQLVVGSGSGDQGVTLYAGTASSSAINFADGTAGSASYVGRILYQHSSNALTFHTNGGTEGMRLDSSQRLLVGTSTNRTGSGLQFQVEGTSYASSSGSFIRNENGSSGASLILGKSRGTTDNSYTIVQSGDGLGTLQFTGTDGSTDIPAAYIQGFVDGTPGTNDMPGRLVFSTTLDGASSPTERMRIDSSGRVGIGTESPGHTLVVRSGTANSAIANFTGFTVGRGLVIATENDGGVGDDTIIYNATESTGSHVFQVNASEKARIDSSGRLLVGTNTTTLNHPIQVVAASDVNAIAIIGRASDDIGELSFYENDQTTKLGEIQYRQDHLNFRHRVGDIRFATGGTTERMRIQTDGTVLIGTADDGALSDSGLIIYNNAACVYKEPGSANHDFLDFYRGTDGSLTRVGNIRTTGSATTYSTSSDYRLKENVVPLTGAADRLNQLQVHRFNFIADPDTTVDGFLAHEAQAVVPEAVHGTKDEVDDDGNPVYQGIDQSKLVPLLTAALQEALQRIETLEQRLSDAGIA